VDDRPVAKRAAARPSPRSFIATGTVDALEHLCTGSFPAPRFDEDSSPGFDVECEDETSFDMSLDAPTVRQLPSDAE
jgi:hypothetical protein